MFFQGFLLFCIKAKIKSKHLKNQSGGCAYFAVTVLKAFHFHHFFVIAITRLQISAFS
jgi:hypothetical protein